MLRFGFVMEQTLGHVTHHQNLARWVAERHNIEAHWLPISVDNPDIWGKVPVVRGNWSLKASLRARDAVARSLRSGPLDALFFHTQTTALFSIGAMRRVPSIVSLDATPLNYDTVAQAYGHQKGNGGWLERRKYMWNRATFREAAHLVTWCRWAKTSLICDYGIDESRISVIPPGVDLASWRVPTEPPRKRESDRLRLLFVGGDFERKGGNNLLDAYRKGLEPICELDIVTRDAGAASVAGGLSGVRVHTGMTPNCRALKDLYRNADLFVFPTLGDCLPIAVMEAMAAGLPVIATGVGALDEEVEDGVNGFVVPVNNVDAIIESVRILSADASKRNAMSAAGRELAELRFDACKNYRALLDAMMTIAAQRGLAKEPMAKPTSQPRVLMLIPSQAKRTIAEAVRADAHPAMDYHALQSALNADILDYGSLEAGPQPALVRAARRFGRDAALAALGYLKRSEYDVIFSNGENVAIPLAVLFRGRRRPGHVLIGHRVSPRKKRAFFRMLHSNMDAIFVYSSVQRDFAKQELGIPGSKLHLIPFHADHRFYRPIPHRDLTSKMICSAGLEWRDYPTLIEAVRGLDVEVRLAAASPWSKHRNETQNRQLPPNVSARRYEYAELRQLYADSQFVVVPLYENDFQAGITTIIEAMAMNRAVITTKTTGQIDTIRHGVNGLYVAPGDVAGWRASIERLLSAPEEARRLAAQARCDVEEGMSLDQWVNRLRGVICEVASGKRMHAPIL